jgi:hypothetical protein
MLKVLRTILAVLLLLVAASAPAFESQWISGLHVTTEQLTGKTALNGVPFRVQRATGRDVPVLAERMRSDWRDSAGDQVLPASESGWRLFGRIHDGRSEVVQWRGIGESSELLWSTMELRDVRRPPPAGTVTLPSGCLWLSPIHGLVQRNRFIQTTGFCPREVSAVAADLRRSLSGKGWRLRQHQGHVLQIERGNQRAQIVLAPASREPDPARATAVVVLEVGIGTKAP